MPLRRIRLRTLMIVIAICALVMAVTPFLLLVFPAFRSDTWGAGKDVPLVITVSDEVTGQPVASAMVQVNHPFRPDLIPANRGTTGADGRFKVVTVADARGRIFVAIPPWKPASRLILQKTERLSFSGGSIDVEAEGYEMAHVPMSEEASRQTVAVRLRRSEEGR